jgi:diguanylate cyclase (GGDEF)-like protein/PAS domain S-box-containing protein
MGEQDLNKERLELALEAGGLDLWENNLVTGDIPRKAFKIMAELGYGEDEALALIDDVFKIVHPDDLARVQAAIADHLAGGSEQYRCEFRLAAKDGRWLWYANYGKVMDRTSGSPGQRFIGVTFNIDDRKRKEEELAQREREWRALTENSPDAICRFDKELRLVYANPAFCELLGDVGQTLGRRLSAYEGVGFSAVFEANLREVFEHGNSVHFEWKCKSKNGREMCSYVRLTPEADASGHFVSVLAVGRDITEIHAYQSELKRVNAQLESMNMTLHNLATEDPLTQLANRRHMLNRLQQAMAASERSSHFGALLFIDLDQFKALNDTMGHHIGDMLLQQIAQRLITCVREADTVARIGGDEFVVMLENLSRVSPEAVVKARATGYKVLSSLGQPYLLDTHFHYNTPSIGGVLFVGQDYSADELLKRADSAMYRSKKNGGNTICFHGQPDEDPGGH